jgi:hypothetical protein
VAFRARQPTPHALLISRRLLLGTTAGTRASTRPTARRRFAGSPSLGFAEENSRRSLV